MLDWMKRRRPAITHRPDRPVEEASRPGPAMSGEYRSLFKYLNERYANTVVLRFADIEALLGFKLPDLARLQGDWWTRTARSPHADSWMLANRTAAPNLLAQTVVFERAR